MTRPATYRVFGLDVRFPRSVHTLAPARAPAGTDCDVAVTFAPLPDLPCEELVNEDLEVSRCGDGMMIRVDEVGRFLVRGGSSVVADPLPGASADEVDLYLAGSVMGAVLHQRGILPLHCNAFDCDGRAILLCGDSGAGKSTLAAWFEARGHALLTDDVCAVTFSSSGEAFGHPGMPRLRLWDDALSASGRDARASRPVPWADGKFELRMAHRRALRPLPIAAIYHLREAQPGEAFAITPLAGLDGVDAITTNIYRRRLADICGRAPDYLADAVRLASQVPVFSVHRTWGMEHFEEQSQILSRHCEIASRNT